MRALPVPAARAWPGMLLAAGLALVWSSVPFWRAPETLFSGDFLDFEHGQNLFLVDALRQDGRWPVRDVFTQYGPLPVLVHAAVAAGFGNSASTYLHLAQALSVLDAVLLFLLLRRAAAGNVSTGTVLLWLGVVVFPAFLQPGAARGLYLWAAYPGFERTALLTLVLLWQPPGERSHRRAVGLGLVLGAMQLIKFGGAVPAGAALLAADAFGVFRPAARGEVAGRRWLGQLAGIGAGFALVEGLWAGWAFAALPADRAARVLWPGYMLANYRAYVTPGMGYLRWHDPSYFRNVQLPVAVALGLNVLGLGWAWRRPSTFPAGGIGRAVLLGMYFPVALAVYLPHATGALPYEWTFLAAAFVPFAALRSRPWQAGVLAVCGLAFVYNVRLLAARPRETLVATDLPNGERLWLNPAHRRAVQELAALPALSKPGARPRVLVLPLASGWAHFFPWETPRAYYQWLMPAFVPATEEESTVDALLAGTDAVVVCQHEPAATPLTADPRTWLQADPRFGPVASARFAARLGEPTRVSDRLTVFPVLRP